MDSYSISFTLGKGNSPHDGNIRHNNREYFAGNVQKENTSLNVEYKIQDIEEAFHQLFDEALKEYNKKQVRKDRVIENYYEHLCNSKRESPFYEAIVQFGNVEDTPCGSQRGEVAKQMLDEYMRDFQKRNPNLFVFNAVLHMDEASPHIHIDFIPFYTKGRTNGLGKGVSMKAALDEQGFKAHGQKLNRLVAWEASERKAMEKILHDHQYVRAEKQAFHRHMTVDEYKLKMADAPIMEALRKQHFVSTEDMTKENIRKLQMTVKNSEQKIAELEKEKSSPHKSFFYSDPDKQAFIQSRMDSMKIPYVETENGFDAQECYAEQIREWEKLFKSSTKSYREKLMEDIDRLLMRCNDVNELYKKLEAEGYKVKLGKYISVGQNEDAIKFDNWTTYTDTSLSTHLDKGSYYARVAAVNNDAAKYTFSDYVTFAVSNPPTISDLEVKYDTSGYTIKCKVSDQGSGINRVQFPTWTVKNDQDDIQSSWWDNPQARGEISGNEVTYRVNISEHNNELGEYVTHIYAYDDSGNYECYAVPHITIENQKPIISNVKIKDIDTSGYTVQCKVIDEGGSGINRVQFPTWTLVDGQDDLFSNWETDSNASGILEDDYVTYRVNISDHNNELTDYKTHIYAYDNCGNYTCYGELPSIDIPTLTTTTSTTTTQKPTTTTTTSTTTTQKPTTTTTTSTTTTQKPTTTTTTSMTTTQKPTTTTTTSTTTTQKPTTTTTSTTTTQKPTTTTNKLDVLKNTTLTLTNGDQYVIPIDTSDLIFSSNNKEVAVVSNNGTITAIGTGEAIISVIDVESNVVQLKINVQPVTTSSVTTTTTSITTTTTITTTISQPVEYKLGDVNNNGTIDAVDASTVLAYYAMISTNKDGGFDDNQKAAADVDHDGKINAVDASNILSYYAYVSTTKEEIMSMEEFMKKK